LTMALNKMSPAVAAGAFIVYSALNGVMLSVIFLVYTDASIATTFFICAATFGVMSVYGWLTKTDLTGLGNLCMMGVFGILIALVANWFIGSARLDYIVSIIGVLVFTGLTAFDTQRIKKLHQVGHDGTAAVGAAARAGAAVVHLRFMLAASCLRRVAVAAKNFWKPSQ
jgi:uncharacterized protein